MTGKAYFTGETLNARLLAGEPPGAYIQPQDNLLVNCDFGNSVNTAGYPWGAVRTGLEAINRWIVAGSLRQESGAIALYTGDSVGWMYQELERSSIDLAGKTVTLTVEGGAPDGVGAGLKINAIGGDTLGVAAVDGDMKTSSLTVTVPEGYTSIAIMLDHYSPDTQPGSKVCTIKNLKLELGDRFTGFYPINPATNKLQTLGNYTDKIFRLVERDYIDGKDVNTVLEYGSYAKQYSNTAAPHYPYSYGTLEIMSGTGENKPYGQPWRYLVELAIAGDGGAMSMRQAMCPEDPTDYSFSEWKEFATTEGINKGVVYEEIIDTFSSPAQLTHAGFYKLNQMTEAVNANIMEGRTPITDWAVGDFHVLLIAGHVSPDGCQYGQLIVTSPRLVSVWIGGIWNYQFTQWTKVATTQSAQLTLLNGWVREYAWDALHVAKNGNVVTLNIAYITNASIAANGSVILILREDMRPVGNMLGQIYNADTGALLTQVLIHTDGAVSIRGQDIPAKTAITMSCSFITN